MPYEPKLIDAKTRRFIESHRALRRELTGHRDYCSRLLAAMELENLAIDGYRITVTIEATAPAAAHGYCGKGSTVAEAVRSLGEMMNKAEGRT